MNNIEIKNRIKELESELFYEINNPSGNNEAKIQSLQTQISSLESQKDNREVFVYRSKKELRHPNLGNYYLARFSFDMQNSKLRTKGFQKTMNNEVYLYLGTYDGIFVDWSQAKQLKYKIRKKSDVERLMKDFEKYKNNKTVVVSEIFCL